jgi:hypothetical protein
MSFLNPFLLAGATAVAVPILIHLLNRRKFQRVVWGAMRFIKASVDQNQRRMQIEDLILLALRCLILALLALALSRPAMKSSSTDLFGQTKVTAVLLIDNSLSMGASDGAETRFDKARKAAEQALDALPAGSSTAILLASDIAQGLIPEPTFDLNLARKTIREARLSDRASDLAPAVQKAVETLQGRAALRKEIYLVTDGQAAGWHHLADIRKAFEQTQAEIRSHILFVGAKEERNLAVSGLSVAGGLTPVNRPIRFEVQVTNFGKEEAKNIRVSLAIGSEPAGDEITVPLIRPGETVGVSLFGRLRTEGFHSVTARIPDDHLPADNRRTVVCRALREARVLLVDGAPGAEPRDSQTFILGHALVPVPPLDREGHFIKTTTVTGAELPATRLDDFDAIVLANVADFPEATVQSLGQYLKRGGGLMIFPGAKVNAGFYNDVLFARHAILPAALGAPEGNAEQEEKFFTLQTRNYEHPVTALWNNPGAGTLGSARFFRAFKLEPAAANAKPASGEAGPARVVLRYAEGAPAVMERAWGLGRVFLFSSTADTAWNDLPVRPAFLALVQRLLGSLVQRQDEGLNVPVGQEFSRQVSLDLVSRDAQIAGPAAAAAREMRRVELLNGVPTIRFATTDLGGAYEVVVNDPPTVIRFAAQPDARESDLAGLALEEREKIGAVARVLDWTPTVSLRELVEKERVGTEFWLPLALLVLALAALETGLAQWFSRAK